MNPLDVVCSSREMAAPRASLQDVLVAVPAHTPAQRQSCQSCVCLMVPAPAELPVLAGGQPGPGGKSFFGVWHTLPVLTEQRWVGHLLPGEEGSTGELSHLSFPNIKDSVKHRRCLWRDSSECPRAPSASPALPAPQGLPGQQRPLPGTPGMVGYPITHTGWGYFPSLPPGDKDREMAACL